MLWLVSVEANVYPKLLVKLAYFLATLVCLSEKNVPNVLLFKYNLSLCLSRLINLFVSISSCVFLPPSYWTLECLNNNVAIWIWKLHLQWTSFSNGVFSRLKMIITIITNTHVPRRYSFFFTSFDYRIRKTNVISKKTKRTTFTHTHTHSFILFIHIVIDILQIALAFVFEAKETAHIECVHVYVPCVFEYV